MATLADRLSHELPWRYALRLLTTLLIALLLTWLLSACGGDSAAEDGATGESAPGARAGREIPTMPAAQFAAPTTMIDPTKVAAAAGETPEAAGADLATGESAYMRLCAECHGDDGTGIADTGSAVTGLNLDAEAMETLLRTGGGFGNEHIFGPSRISEDGIVALAAYMQTLGE